MKLLKPADEFRFLMSMLEAEGGSVLNGAQDDHWEPYSAASALAELGLLTDEASNNRPGPAPAPTALGWRLLAAWWTRSPSTESYAESAAYMATGRYRVTHGSAALERIPS